MTIGKETTYYATCANKSCAGIIDLGDNPQAAVDGRLCDRCKERHVGQNNMMGDNMGQHAVPSDHFYAEKGQTNYMLALPAPTLQKQLDRIEAKLDSNQVKLTVILANLSKLAKK